jgi:hypothetical protein
MQIVSCTPCTARGHFKQSVLGLNISIAHHWRATLVYTIHPLVNDLSTPTLVQVLRRNFADGNNRSYAEDSNQCPSIDIVVVDLRGGIGLDQNGGQIEESGNVLVRDANNIVPLSHEGAPFCDMD